MQAAAHPGLGGDGGGADRVHQEVAVALHHRHHRLELVEDPALVLVEQADADGRRPVVGARRPRRADHLQRPLQERHGLELQRREEVVDEAPEVPPEPGIALELRPVGQLVGGHPEAEVPGDEAETTLRDDDTSWALTGSISYCPSTRWEMKPSTPPSCAPRADP